MLRRPRWKMIALVLGAATFVSVVVATQNYLAFQAQNALAPPAERIRLSWMHLLALELPVWYSWAALMPGVVYVARRLPIAGAGWWRRLPAHLIASALATLLMIMSTTLVRNLVGLESSGHLPYWQLVDFLFRRYFALFGIIYFAIVATHDAFMYYDAFRARAVRESQLEAMLATARLDALKMQLHPHFLFNTLHAVSSLMATDVRGARRMIARLSDLLRLSLENDAAQEVALRDELAFLAQYVEIQQMRFRERLVVDTAVPTEALDLRVPRLVLQPLVENAIRHGVERIPGVGHVRVAARVDGARLLLSVADNGPGLAGDARRDGVGLGNTRARLAQLYGESARLTLEPPATTQGGAGGLVVTIELPALPASAPAAPTPGGESAAGGAATGARVA